MALSTSSNFAKPDDAFRVIVEAHRGLSEEQSADLDAALVLVLANHIGDLDVREAIVLAKRRMLDAAAATTAATIRIRTRTGSMAKVLRPPRTLQRRRSLSEIGTDLYAFTAEGDRTRPSSSATTAAWCSTRRRRHRRWPTIERVRTVTDKPIKYVVLSHYHAVRVLGASAYKAQGIVASQETYRLVARTQPNRIGIRIWPLPPPLPGRQSIPGLTWPTA